MKFSLIEQGHSRLTRLMISIYPSRCTDVKASGSLLSRKDVRTFSEWRFQQPWRSEMGSNRMQELAAEIRLQCCQECGRTVEKLWRISQPLDLLVIQNTIPGKFVSMALGKFYLCWGGTRMDVLLENFFLMESLSRLVCKPLIMVMLMRINLHKNAKTTPAQRLFIQANEKISASILAKNLGVSEATVRKWKQRDSVYDRSHIPIKVATAMTPVQEVMVGLIRLCLRPGLDDLQSIVRQFIFSGCSRSGLNRCLKRYHISRLETITDGLPDNLHSHEGVYLYCTVICLPDFSDSGRTCLIHTVLDCSTRWVHMGVSSTAKPLPAGQFIDTFVSRYPVKVKGLIAAEPIDLSGGDGGFSVIDGHHERLFRACGIDCYRLENHHADTLEAVRKSLRSTQESAHCQSRFLFDELKNRLLRNADIYNTLLGQRALGGKTPRQKMEQRYLFFPGSFRFKPKQSIGTRG